MSANGLGLERGETSFLKGSTGVTQEVTPAVNSNRCAGSSVHNCSFVLSCGRFSFHFISHNATTCLQMYTGSGQSINPSVFLTAVIVPITNHVHV